ncbi:glucoamylase [Physcia stellaris]|nr:glucoamylase [Physcia stellaris]
MDLTHVVDWVNATYRAWSCFYMIKVGLGVSWGRAHSRVPLALGSTTKHQHLTIAFIIPRLIDTLFSAQLLLLLNYHRKTPETTAVAHAFMPSTTRNVAILYQIITSAEQHPDVETKPFRAIFANTYDEVLAQHGINPDHDQIYFRFLLKLGDKTREGRSLYECFEALLEECGIRIEIDFNEGRVQEIPLDTDTAGSRDAEVRESTVPRANTNTPKRARRASFESFYDVVEDSIRPVEPLARSQAPTSLSQLHGDNAPAPRPSTRATTRDTEKPQAQRLLNRSLAAQAYKERRTAKEFANDFDSSHPGFVAKQTKALPGEPSSVIQATRRSLSSPTRSFSEVGVLNGNHVPLADTKHAPYTANQEVFLRPPTETQLMRDVDIFRHVSTRHVARTMLQKWCALGFEAKIHHKGMARQANSHDLGILMRQGYQQWHTKFLQRKKDVETRHFFKSLERRASKARDLYLLAKAFTHWAQIASDHVDRTSAVRRHLLELKCFNAWYEVTIINDLKVRQHRLSRCLRTWKQSHARTETSYTQAIILHNECVVKAAYWRWFWTFCERRAPEWRAGRLKKNLFGNWASRQHSLSYEQQLVADLRTEKIVTWSFLKWLESTRALLMRSREATSFERQNCLVHALEAWKLQWRYAPRVQQISNIVDWRVAGTTFAVVVTRYRASRQAENVRRLRILRNSWTKWNDALRQGYLAKRIDDRVLTEQLYKWALSHRCGLLCWGARNIERMPVEM